MPQRVKITRLDYARYVPIKTALRRYSTSQKIINNFYSSDAVEGRQGLFEDWRNAFEVESNNADIRTLAGTITRSVPIGLLFMDTVEDLVCKNLNQEFGSGSGFY